MIEVKNPSTYNNIVVNSYQEKNCCRVNLYIDIRCFISKIPPLICNKSRTLLLIQSGLWALTKAWKLCKKLEPAIGECIAVLS